jgi:hypothetical protein
VQPLRDCRVLVAHTEWQPVGLRVELDPSRYPMTAGSEPGPKSAAAQRDATSVVFPDADYVLPLRWGPTMACRSCWGTSAGSLARCAS